jgi:hypothetical protein
MNDYSLEELYQIYLIKCLFTDVMENYEIGILTFEEFIEVTSCKHSTNMV